ncbi:MAG TPA: phosphoenolpyruvate carboxykinase (ATP), partial [Alphaproteobacteria bacterium]|nr:phosphoenolpyruvate carboxykinase (ATP) [Alphaproteobacteria bacterium]
MPAIDTAATLETLLKSDKVHRNLHSGILVEHAVRRGEGLLADNGALVAYTGKYTGRTPKDKFTVKDPVTTELVNWGDVNQPFDPEKFDALFDRVTASLRNKELFVQDLYAGADSKYRLPIRVINEYAWHSLFVRALFVRPSTEELKTHRAEFTIVAAPEFQADPQRDGTRSEAFIVVSFTRKIVLIGGTKYAGEMKKSIFGVMNFLLPQNNVFPMHCSANVGKNGETALF